jgi:hypothetical protein
MVGVGRVFEWYRDGVLTDDDEVAVIHGPAESGFVAQSEALVNIRAAANAAAERRVVSADMARRLIDIAKSQFYPERSYAALARLALEHGLDREPVDAFVAFAKSLEPVKRQDARALLRKMREPGAEPLPERGRTRVERTFFLERLKGQVELELAVSQSKAQSELSPSALNDLRKRTLLRVLAIKHASDLGMVATPEETQTMADDFRLARQLISPEEMQAWLLAADLTLERFSEVVRELATVRKLEQHYALEVERRLASHLQLGLGPER